MTNFGFCLKICTKIFSKKVCEFKIPKLMKTDWIWWNNLQSLLAMALTYVDMSSVIEIQVHKSQARSLFFCVVEFSHKSIFILQERLTSHGGGLGLTAGTPAYTGHTGSGGRSSSLSSSQHGHGPSTHQSADFQPPYFPPPFHHSSTHQSPAGTHQQQQASIESLWRLN